MYITIFKIINTIFKIINTILKIINYSQFIQCRIRQSSKTAKIKINAKF